MEDKTPKSSSSSSSSDDSGVGAPGKGKNKSASKKASKAASTSTKKLTPTDDEWPKDLPKEYDAYINDCNNILREAMHQGGLGLCWAVALSRYIEALFLLKRGVKVELSAQHLVNSIKNKLETGKVTKYNEIRKFLMEEGLVPEKCCPYTGELDQTCPKSCAKYDQPSYKITGLHYIKGKHINEEELIKIVEKTPVLAVVEAFASFKEYKDV